MRERQQIVELAAGQQASVLLTVVARRGSAYRREGAHLLISDTGEYAGTISGGCLEAELLTKAAWMVKDGAQLKLYSAFFDDFSEIPYGLGCGGEVEILLERADTPEYTAWIAAAANSLNENASTVCTVLPENSSQLARIIFSSTGEVVFASISLSGVEIQKEFCNLCAESGKNGIQMLGDKRIFVERLLPPPRLVLFGAWEDAQPLCEMAAGLGWTVEIADGRAQFVMQKRFPAAHRLHLLGKGPELDGLELKPEDFVVLMTHSFQQDLNLLCALDKYPLQYIGLLGAYKRSATLLSLAAKRVGCSFQALAARVHAPAGLAIGAEGPHAIALSILAQVEAVRNGIAQPKNLIVEAEESLLNPKC